MPWERPRGGWAAGRPPAPTRCERPVSPAPCVHPKPRSAGLGGSAPRLAKWLGDIRTYFKDDVVSVIQADAIERKGLTPLLFEPETLRSVQPNVQLVGTLMSLRGRIPERTKETARFVVAAVVVFSVWKWRGSSVDEGEGPPVLGHNGL